MSTLRCVISNDFVQQVLSPLYWLAGVAITQVKGLAPDMSDKQQAVEGLSSMHKHIPEMTALTVKGVPLRCADFNTISRIPTLQHLIYICIYFEHGTFRQQQDRGNPYNIARAYLFAADGQRSPLEGLTNLVSLHIEEEIPNVHAEHLQSLSLLTQLTHLALHCPAQYDDETDHFVQPMTEPVYQALGGLPKLVSLQVDIGSPHMTLLKGLKALSITKCEPDWDFPCTFTSLTCLSEVLILTKGWCRTYDPFLALNNPLILSSVGYMPCVHKVTFCCQADPKVWTFLADLKNVVNLTLDHCDLSNEAFQALGRLTQLTSLDFTMSHTSRDIVDVPRSHAFDNLMHLSRLHGKFVSTRGSCHGYRLGVRLAAWYRLFSRSSIFQAIQDVQLSLCRIPEYSEWMSEFEDGDDMPRMSYAACSTCLRDVTPLSDLEDESTAAL